MPERVGRVEHVDAGEAQERLARLSAFAEQVPGVRGAALRDLRAQHDRRPPAAVEAYREASGAAGLRHGELRALVNRPGCRLGGLADRRARADAPARARG
jgi:hypothetical protein